MNTNLDFTGAEFEIDSLDFRPMLARAIPDENQTDTGAFFAIALDSDMIGADSES